MKLRTLESDTRMRFLLGSNPIGELVKILSRQCTVTARRKSYGKQVRVQG
jgi:hypothetical protein